VENFHHDFLILRSQDSGALRRVGRAIHQRNFDFVEEVIVTTSEVLLKLNRMFSPEKLAQLEKLDLADQYSNRSFRLPVLFDDHKDWKNIMEHSGLTKGEVLEKLAANRFSVAMLGFLPGFIYLDGLPEELQIPRKSIPDKYVQSGSVAIGGKYLGVYALDSPGGWHVIGKTPIQLLELPELPPISFLPGDQFHIHPIDQIEYDQLFAQSLTLKDYNADS
jgi:KipI family sensor histidine kinase inhibitor